MPWPPAASGGCPQPSVHGPFHTRLQPRDSVITPAAVPGPLASLFRGPLTITPGSPGEPRIIPPPQDATLRWPSPFTMQTSLFPDSNDGAGEGITQPLPLGALTVPGRRVPTSCLSPSLPTLPVTHSAPATLVLALFLNTQAHLRTSAPAFPSTRKGPSLP